MLVFGNNKKPAVIYLGNTEISNIYYKGINIWPDALNLISCFALGYWEDAYGWSDEYAWKDNIM
jgi:hypothetical protein